VQKTAGSFLGFPLDYLPGGSGSRKAPALGKAVYVPFDLLRNFVGSPGWGRTGIDIAGLFAISRKSGP
jgi:hypothetical protein